MERPLPASLAARPNIDLADQTAEQIAEERAWWQAEVDGATGWGAALGFAGGMLRACDREMARRVAGAAVAR